MNFSKIPESTEVIPISKPQFYRGGDTAVLIIHGFTGSPHEMIYLGKRLNDEGFSVFIPRLPGHGTNRYDFLNSCWKDWLRTSSDAYINLKASHKRVYIAGLSMGGLLATIIASKYKPEKIALAAPAIEVSDWMLKLTPFFKYFIKRIKNKKKKEYEDENMRKLADEYWDSHFIAKLADFHYLQKMAKQRLKDIVSDTLVIVSENDNTVPLSVADLIEKNISAVHKKRVVLKESSHVVVNDIEKEKVSKEIIEWFK